MTVDADARASSLTLPLPLLGGSVRSCFLARAVAPPAADADAGGGDDATGSGDEERDDDEASLRLSARDGRTCTSSSSPTSSGETNFQASWGPGAEYLPTAAVRPWPTRAPSRSMNHDVKFPVNFAELDKAPQ